jgi:hypothetical protein
MQWNRIEDCWQQLEGSFKRGGRKPSNVDVLQAIVQHLHGDIDAGRNHESLAVLLKGDRVRADRCAFTQCAKAQDCGSGGCLPHHGMAIGINPQIQMYPDHSSPISGLDQTLMFDSARNVPGNVSTIHECRYELGATSVAGRIDAKRFELIG